jgi:hypothetical protein
VSEINDSLSEGCYVVLHIGTGPSASTEKSGSPLVVRNGRNRFVLRDDIWIERLDEQLAKNIQHACQPPNYGMDDADYDRHLYAFVRRVPNIEKSSYEGMADLHAVIALSRLVNPTSTGDRYCAQVLGWFGARKSPIRAIQYRGISPDVSLATKPRDWLSIKDGEVLRMLVPCLSKKMHDRVHRAYWNHEYAMRSYYLDARWPLVVSGLEALVNVEEREVTRQFCDRVRQLAEEFHVNLKDADLRVAYKLRSKLVHAESFLSGMHNILPKSEHSPLYERLELLLRETVKRCLLDETFGNFFRNDAAVEKRWPLHPLSPRNN